MPEMTAKDPAMAGPSLQGAKTMPQRRAPGEAPLVRRRVSRRRPRPVWLRPILMLLAVVAVTAVLVGGYRALSQAGVFARWTEEIAAKAGDMLIRAGFVVRDVTVEGRRRTARADLVKAVGLKAGDMIFIRAVADIRRDVEALPWVRRADVRRRLPDRIYIRLEERRPFARWQVDGKRYLIDRDGVVIEPLGDKRRDLPLLVGRGAPERVDEVLSLSHDMPLAGRRIVAAVLIRERRWDVELDNGVLIRLPEEGMSSAWKQFAAIVNGGRMPLENVAEIDLRIRGRLIARLSEEAAALRRLVRND